MTDFSVLLSLYAKESPTYLELALDSIYASSLLPTEVIVVKDGPLTNELEQVLKKYQAIKYVPLTTNHGLSYALNKGLEACKCNLIARMDTDDICHKDRFKKQIDYFDTHPDVDVVGTYAYKIDETGDTIGLLKVPSTHDEIFSKVWTCPFIHPTVMFRKDSILRIGGYNSDAGPRQDDYDLWFRCAWNGFKFANIPEPLFYYRFFSDSIRKNNIKVGWYRFKVGCKGCRKLHFPFWTYIGVFVPFFRSLLPYPLNVYFNKFMEKINPRNN